MPHLMAMAVRIIAVQEKRNKHEKQMVHNT